MRIWLACLCLFGLASCSQRGPHGDWLEGQSGAVARVIDGDSFVLEDGLVVRLVSVEAPSFGSRGREDMPYAEEAKRALERLTLGRRVQLYYPGLTQDRYERALAQVYVFDEAGKSVWLNEAIVEAGAAWVRLYPDTLGGSDPLWAAEAAARDNLTGLWSSAAPYAETSQIITAEGGFVIMSAQLINAGMVEEDCGFQMEGSTVIVRFSANSGCDPFPSGPLEIRGWARNGTLDAGVRENIRLVD